MMYTIYVDGVEKEVSTQEYVYHLLKLDDDPFLVISKLIAHLVDEGIIDWKAIDKLF